MSSATPNPDSELQNVFADLHFHNYHENGTEMQWEAWLCNCLYGAVVEQLQEARTRLELWKQRAVVAELEILADRMQRQVDFPTIFPELKGLEHGQRMAKFGWMQAGREINDRIQRLTARPDTEGDKDE